MKDNSNVLLSFKSHFAKPIYEGVKLYDIRKSRILRANPQSFAFIYEVEPVGAVTGHFEIGESDWISPRKVLTQYHLDNLTEEYVKDLRDKRSHVYIMEIKDPIKFITGIDPLQISHFRNIPPSFRYLTRDEFQAICKISSSKVKKLLGMLFKCRLGRLSH